MAKCQYYIEYIDNNREKIPFECKLDAKNSGFCIFHHKEYHIDNSEEVINKLNKEIEIRKLNFLTFFE